MNGNRLCNVMHSNNTDVPYCSASLIRQIIVNIVNIIVVIIINTFSRMHAIIITSRHELNVLLFIYIWISMLVFAEAEHGYASVLPFYDQNTDKRRKVKSKRGAAGNSR